MHMGTSCVRSLFGRPSSARTAAGRQRASTGVTGRAPAVRDMLSSLHAMETRLDERCLTLERRYGKKKNEALRETRRKDRDRARLAAREMAHLEATRKMLLSLMGHLSDLRHQIQQTHWVQDAVGVLAEHSAEFRALVNDLEEQLDVGQLMERLHEDTSRLYDLEHELAEPLPLPPAIVGSGLQTQDQEEQQQQQEEQQQEEQEKRGEGKEEEKEEQEEDEEDEGEEQSREDEEEPDEPQDVLDRRPLLPKTRPRSSRPKRQLALLSD